LFSLGQAFGKTNSLGFCKSESLPLIRVIIYNVNLHPSYVTKANFSYPVYVSLIKIISSHFTPPDTFSDKEMGDASEAI
jgi:hypothetical protein